MCVYDPEVSLMGICSKRHPVTANLREWTMPKSFLSDGPDSKSETQIDQQERKPIHEYRMIYDYI